MVLDHIQVAANQGDYLRVLTPDYAAYFTLRNMDQASQSKNGAASDSD
jgi:hypothetical protein